MTYLVLIELVVATKAPKLNYSIKNEGAMDRGQFQSFGLILPSIVQEDQVPLHSSEEL